MLARQSFARRTEFKVSSLAERSEHLQDIVLQDELLQDKHSLKKSICPTQSSVKRVGKRAGTKEEGGHGEE